MNADEQIAVVKAALAEAGYPNARVKWTGKATDLGEPELVWTGAPRDVAWRASAVVQPLIDRPLACWPCWRDGVLPCTHDYREQPWPELTR